MVKKVNQKEENSVTVNVNKNDKKAESTQKSQKKSTPKVLKKTDTLEQEIVLKAKDNINVKTQKSDKVKKETIIQDKQKKSSQQTSKTSNSQDKENVVKKSMVVKSKITDEKPKAAEPKQPVKQDLAKKITPKAKQISQNMQDTSLVPNKKAKGEPVKIESVVDKKSKIFVPSILQAPKDSSPEYIVQDSKELAPKKIEFKKIVPQEEMIELLNKNHFMETEESVQKILQAVLRGSDVSVYIRDLKSPFLIAAIGSISKFLSGSLPRVEAKQPVALVLALDEKKAKELYQSSLKVFDKLNVQLSFISEKVTDQEKQEILSKNIDVLYSTPNALRLLGDSINLNSIGLCFVYDTQYLEKEEKNLSEILSELPQERVQKVFISTENIPKTRQLNFQHLENAESFNFLPCFVKDKSPKQFAHALTSTQKFQVLLGHLKTHKPSCAIVFANTRSVAEWIAFKLHGNDIKVELVTSTLNYQKRQSLLKNIASGETNIIVTTDYCTSSLGFENLNCLYQFDLPDSPAKFTDRLCLIEKSRNPLSISFICEDYGFNMGKIEDSLGFKIFVNQPDKEYFKLKDASDYPLEADGRVKRIGYVAPAPVLGATQSSFASSSISAAVSKPLAASPEIAVSTNTLSAKPVASALTQNSQFSSGSKPISNVAPQQQVRPKTVTRGDTASNYQKPHQIQEGESVQSKFEAKSNPKFVRRDDRAKEALDAARMAAQEKRKTTQKAASVSDKNKSVVSLAVFMVQDAFKAASSAARDSFAKNMEENMPLFSSLLSKVPFLKKTSSQKETTD
jgi:superfamily II DNA/RNA helicase